MKPVQWSKGCRREDSNLTSLSFHKERVSQLVLQGWCKDFEKRAWHSTFWSTTQQPPTTRPSKAFRYSKTNQRSLDTIPNYAQYMDIIPTITIASTSQIGTGAANVVMQPHPTQTQSTNISSTYAHYMIRSTGAILPWSLGYMRP